MKNSSGKHSEKLFEFGVESWKCLLMKRSQHNLTLVRSGNYNDENIVMEKKFTRALPFSSHYMWDQHGGCRGLSNSKFNILIFSDSLVSRNVSNDYGIYKEKINKIFRIINRRIPLMIEFHLHNENVNFTYRKLVKFSAVSMKRRRCHRNFTFNGVNRWMGWVIRHESWIEMEFLKLEIPNISFTYHKLIIPIFPSSV